MAMRPDGILGCVRNAVCPFWMAHTQLRGDSYENVRLHQRKIFPCSFRMAIRWVPKKGNGAKCFPDVHRVLFLYR